MKLEGRSLWIIVAIAIVVIALFGSYKFGQSRSSKQLNTLIEQERKNIQQEYKGKISGLETERDKYKADYERLTTLLAKKAKERANIKPPKDAAELKERLDKLGYPAKEIR